MCGVNSCKLLEVFGHRCAGQTRPHGGANADYGIKLAVVITEVYGLKQSSESRKHIAGGLLAAIVDLKDQDERCAGRLIYYMLNRHTVDFTHP